MIWIASATEIIMVLIFGLKNRKAGLDRPLKVGGGIQPLLVTVLTPATTCAVGVNFIQNAFRVNRTEWLFVF
jgi:hypothetical protein